MISFNRQSVSLRRLPRSPLIRKPVLSPVANQPMNQPPEHGFLPELDPSCCTFAPELGNCQIFGSGERAPARDDRRAAALGQELVERQAEAALAAVGGDRRGCIVRAHEGRDRGAADAPCLDLGGELLLPPLEPGCRIAALRGARLAGRARERQGRRGDALELLHLSHSELLTDRMRCRRYRRLSRSLPSARKITRRERLRTCVSVSR